MLEKTEMKSENRYHKLYPLHRKEHCFACLCLYNGKQLDSGKIFLESTFSVQFSHSAISNSLWPHALQHARLPCPSPAPRACSNSSPSSQWCHPTISSSVIPFSSCLLLLAQHQGLFQWVSSSHQVAKVLEFQLQHQSFQWTPRTDLL